MPNYRKILITILLFFCILNIQTKAIAQEWHEMKGEHFIVYSFQDEKFMRNILNTAESYYQKIAEDLGYSRTSVFWTWDNRVKIYIYADKTSYLKASGQPDWSEGMANYQKKEILSYLWNKNFIESLLPHEITHLILRDFIGFSTKDGDNIPVWLDEGIAQWEENQTSRTEIITKAKKLYEKNALLSIIDILRLNIKIVDKKGNILYFRWAPTKEGSIGLLILSPDVLINTYYIEAGSIVGFLITTRGSHKFNNFCKQLRDGKTLEEALHSAYLEYIDSISELQEKWLKSLAEPAPETKKVIDRKLIT